MIGALRRQNGVEVFELLQLFRAPNDQLNFSKFVYVNTSIFPSFQIPISVFTKPYRQNFQLENSSSIFDANHFKFSGFSH